MNRRTCASVLRTVAAVGGMFAMSVQAARAGEGGVPTGVPQFDHVFFIIMENHIYEQIVGNPDAPFTNRYMGVANTGTNYFAIAHPSLTNYLEI
ncbi:MAG TPA: phosphoesterase, partial [Thermoanaerobaculia bacterium]|nr:phosphoesterase [Thermoanaerobaculia bacterium]